MKVDYLVVGSGLTGATIARLLADAGREVLVVDRRDHVGGNVHDHVHPSGIRVHTYGPHYFRTSSDKVWDFATRFGAFDKYEAKLLSLVDGRYEQWPVAGSYIKRVVGADWKPELANFPADFEEAALNLMPRVVYEKFVRDYTEKQWGVSCRELNEDLCTRFDVRDDDDPRLKPNAKYQGIPHHGYAKWTREMLEGIPVILNYDYLRRRHDIAATKRLVFTGPIDEFFGFELGRLTYRGQRRVHTYHADEHGFAFPCGQVNNPSHAGGSHIRTLEWKHMMPPRYADRICGTLLTTETPFSPTDPNDYEYPFPDHANRKLYNDYRERAHAVADQVLICGRLGEGKYLDMDQSIARAMLHAERLLLDT